MLGGLLGCGFVVGVEGSEGGETDEEAGGHVAPRAVQQGVLAPGVVVDEGVVRGCHLAPWVREKRLVVWHATRDGLWQS